jgi:hypothetical protein
MIFATFQQQQKAILSLLSLSESLDGHRLPSALIGGHLRKSLDLKRQW